MTGIKSNFLTWLIFGEQFNLTCTALTAMVDEWDHWLLENMTGIWRKFRAIKFIGYVKVGFLKWGSKTKIDIMFIDPYEKNRNRVIGQIRRWFKCESRKAVDRRDNWARSQKLKSGEYAVLLCDDMHVYSIKYWNPDTFAYDYGVFIPQMGFEYALQVWNEKLKELDY